MSFLVPEIPYAASGFYVGDYSSLDVVGPTVVLSGPSAVQVAAFDVAVVFNESFTETLINSMFTVVKGTVGALSGSGESYTLNVVPDSDSNGNVEITFPAGIVSDSFSNTNSASNTLLIPFDTLPETGVLGLKLKPLTFKTKASVSGLKLKPLTFKQ